MRVIRAALSECCATFPRGVELLVATNQPNNHPHHHARPMRRVFLLQALVPDPAHGELRQPKKCRNPVPAATWWLHDPEKEKPRYRLDSRVSLYSLVGPEGFEPSTNGLRVHEG